MSGLRTALLTAVAGQLGRPHGLVGRGVALLLNRGNRQAVAGAVDATEATAGNAVADIGFGGGLGLELLLRRVAPQGTVHGVEIADDMLARARARFDRQIAAGSLVLERGSLTALPLDDKSLDAAITVNTVYFVTDLDAACAELARVLRPGGRAVLGVGDPDAMARLPFTAYGFALRPIAEIVASLRRAGLENVEQRRLNDVAIPHHVLVAR
ncbi:class I SAM-dependent methyltransferase [Mycolicibacterium pallens]|uniref:Methyltransferase domain-containing protein n=1 Tax=Mycolicibacterium pallens TaxID=370524 RepID=A0ABX8VK75_9MYCO|nr:methyltransferase domain-containing protein [Mycolicibacterium pallens]QYL18190.1 methyltransferase domain-containing protein [Mycolicibacterium pallens]